MDKNKICQSCGMPLSRDEQGGGTNSNGTRNDKYCSHCYQRGAFVLPDITAEEMRTRVIGKMGEFHIPGFVARLMTRNLSKLERWRSA